MTAPTPKQDLSTFLREAVLSDLKALSAFSYSGQTFLDSVQKMNERQKFLRGEGENITLPRGFVATAAAISFCNIGERVKEIERLRPDVIQQFPEFPWTALKHMRDDLTHYGRSYVQGEDLAALAAKDIKVFDDYLRNTPMPERERFWRYISQQNETPFQDMYHAYTTGRMARNMLLEYKGEPIVPMANNRALESEKTHYRPHADILPTVIIDHNLRAAALGMADAVDSFSAFYRSNSGIGAASKPLFFIRNQSAHFARHPMQVSPSTQQTFARDLMGLNPYVVSAHGQLSKWFDPQKPELVKQAGDNLFASYSNDIRQKLGGDKDKKAVLEETVQFITGSKKNKLSLQTSVVMAMANLLEVTTSQEGQAVLCYLQKSPTAIRNPSRMRSEISSVPHATKVRVNQFLENVDYLMRGYGSGAGKE